MSEQQITLHSSGMYRRRLVGPSVRHCLTYYRLLRKYDHVSRDFARAVITETLLSARGSEQTIERRKEGPMLHQSVATLSDGEPS